MAGILLHPTSLPGPGMQGTLGMDALRFIEFLHAAGIKVWQMLPLGQPHMDGSPYQCMSVHAGNIQLICPRTLHQWGWIGEPTDFGGRYRNPFDCELLKQAHAGFLAHASEGDRAGFEAFVHDNAHWLEDYVLYLAFKGEHGGAPWWDWPAERRDRDAAVLRKAVKRLASTLQQHRFEQYVFYRQWADLKRQANALDIQLFGDMPIFVAHDSSDVWAHRHLFDLDATGHPNIVTGVPPDYFSDTGQRWGNPHYDWQAMEADGFAWWRERLRGQLEFNDLIRIDHFRGFESSWAIPSHEPTAVNGWWVPAPGEALFGSLYEDLGHLPLVAEDLGIITPEVEALRDRFHLPGMKILQFAFEGGAKNPYLPHNHIANCVVYTGTHDNDTTLGWFRSCEPALQQHVLDYLGEPREEMPWPLVREAFASVAQLAVVPMQDVLALDGEHRMNTPGTCDDNWRWRFHWDMVSPDLPAQLRHLVETYGR
ncbi:MAG: 4-alpha-glucanotransferase [Chromatiales bacterium]|jgi:4-alpha-glucanotransferase|nr:4-alpha-glucanotransferase [Chromatiales bacterium]MDX9766572.1 4-alpha-glucanotransferase [Ectothiorhodospiraceae bacterium]